MTGVIEVTMVPAEHVASAWGAVSEYMQNAADYTNGRYDSDDILNLITEYGYVLWLAFDETDIKGAVVTCFTTYPKKKYLYLMFCGGEDGPEWKDKMLAILRRWAADNHCDGIEGTGRMGWEKIFKADGYKPHWQVFELPVVGA